MFLLKEQCSRNLSSICTADSNYTQLSVQGSTGEFETLIISEEIKRTVRTMTYAHLRGTHALNMGSFMKK